MTQAITRRWPVTDPIKQAVVDRMMECLQDDPEIAVAAARVIVAAERQNQDDKLKRRARDARIAIQNILQLGEPGAPDPEYVRWKQQQLMGSPQLAPADQDVLADTVSIAPVSDSRYSPLAPIVHALAQKKAPPDQSVGLPGFLC